MEIKEIDIDTFAGSNRYGTPRLEPRNETLVVHGKNRTGKSLTFSAIGYGVIGESWDKSVGRNACVETTLSDGTEYEANRNGHELRTPGKRSFESQRARDEREERICGKPFREYLFLPSQVAKLPLLGKSESDVLETVREAVAPDKYEEIDELRGGRNQKLDQADGLREKKSDLEDRLTEYPPAIETRGEQIEREERIVELHDDGHLEGIRETLADHAELDEQLQVAYDEREELTEELQNLRYRREHLEGESTAEPSAKEFDLDCPACGGTVTKETAQERIGSGCCPLCARGTNFDTLLLTVDDDDSVEELDDQIAEVEAELQAVNERIERLQSEQPGLGELDDEVLRRLNRRNRNVERVVEAARSKIEDLEDEVAQLEDQQEQDEARIEELSEKIENKTEQAEELEDKFESIQREIRDRVVDFQDRWTENFRRMCPSLAVGIALNDNDGVSIAGDPDRNLHTDDDQSSDAEKQLLCLSFGVTLHQTLGDGLPLDTFVLDEPFDHLDAGATQELLSFVTEDDDRQYIFTTSDDTVVEAFPEDQRRELEEDPRQMTLGEPTEDDRE